MCKQTVGISHRGYVRSVNEDRKLIRSFGNGPLMLAVADGLGGGVCGTQAAEITMACLQKLQIGAGGISQSLGRAVQEADSKIRWIVSQNERLEGMGSTLTAVVVDGLHAHWVHVGDSRLYHLRKDELTQITNDQNMAQFLVEEGDLTIEEARLHPSQNQLDQCVGCGDCDPDMGRFSVETGDLLVLTTDGMHGGIPQVDLIRHICRNTDMETKADDLLRSALKTGGEDNITVVMGRV